MLYLDLILMNQVEGLVLQNAGSWMLFDDCRLASCLWSSFLDWLIANCITIEQFPQVFSSPPCVFVLRVSAGSSARCWCTWRFSSFSRSPPLLLLRPLVKVLGFLWSLLILSWFSLKRWGSPVEAGPSTPFLGLVLHYKICTTSAVVLINYWYLLG